MRKKVGNASWNCDSDGVINGLRHDSQFPFVILNRDM